jgi:hypothetical protein
MTAITHPGSPLGTDYHGAIGLPRHFYHHNGGQTRNAVLAYVRYMADPIMEPAPDAFEMRLIVGYCAYFINAPCWLYPERELGMLRSSIEHIKLPHELANWLWGAAQIGIDPL